MCKEIIGQFPKRFEFVLFEGNATIQIEIDQNRVLSARFMVEDFRGFEKLCQGKDVAFIPAIVSRICGLCCMAHQAASVRAIEDALEIAVPETVGRLRQAAVYGEWIASHAISYFFLTQPDMLGANQGIFGLMQQVPQVAEVAFSIQKAGSRIVEILGGRSVHPIAMQVGGMSALPSRDDLNEIVSLAQRVAGQVRPILSELERRLIPERAIAFPEHSRVNFLCCDENSGSNNRFNIYGLDGGRENTFDVSVFEEHVSEMRADWSFAKFPYLSRLGFPDGIFHVGPLARAFSDDCAINMKELQDYAIIDQAKASRGVHIEHIDIMRLAERHIEKGALSEFGQQSIGRCIRLFDPCLTCATH